MGFGGFLQANTAVDVLIGPFIDDTDGKTAETGLTLSQADIKLSKNGQALAQKNDDTAAAHDANGYYNCELDATDTNTEGTLTLIVHESGALPVRMDFMVLSQAAYASLVTAKDSGYMDVNVKAVSEDTTAADNLESACDNYSVTRGLAGTALPAAAADSAGGLPISDAGGLDLDAKLANTNEVTAARMGALTDLIDGGRLDLILDAIVADTNELQTDWVNGGRLDLLIDALYAAIITNAAGVDIAADIIALKAETATILADTNELQGDLVNGGRLDLLIDAIKAAIDKCEDILGNKMDITDATGAVTLYADDSTTPLLTSTVVDDLTTTSRGKLS